MISIQLQEQVEHLDNIRTIEADIKAFLEQQQPFMDEFNKALTTLGKWSNHTFSYESKNQRLQQLKHVDLKEILWSVCIFLCINARDQELFVNVAVPLADQLGYGDRFDGIQTIMEIVAVVSRSSRLCSTFKRSKQGQMLIKCNYKLPEDMWTKAASRMHKPPIMSKPKHVKNNLQSAYRTYNKSVFCKSHVNHHDGDVCLDVINIVNNVRLAADLEFMSYLQDEPSEEIKSKNAQYLSSAEIAELIEMRKENFEKFLLEQSYHISLLENYGNDFSLNHRVDARGRLYAEGYIFNYQGNDYRKAMLNFAEEVELEIPNEFL